MRREVGTEDYEFETVLMRRFHLTPGQPEYVVVKRRLTQDADQQRVERERSMPHDSLSRPTLLKRKHKAPAASAYKKQGLSTKASETVNKEGGKVSGTSRGKHGKKAPGHKAGHTRKRNRSAA